MRETRTIQGSIFECYAEHDTQLQIRCIQLTLDFPKKHSRRQLNLIHVKIVLLISEHRKAFSKK